ncbi:3840_t:CDS:10 [Dentiscutata erythropus]|uniref:3840_t:CDS:1 n=1 Tax=Dentiscutata erythropus TaxID=1348616 RepID=A0A9N9B2B4_9GLOM|nr:3840_t:CDS:10 [Dentiscutata erythropus]
MSRITLMKIIVLFAILCALPCYSIDYPQYPANEIPNLSLTPPLTNFVLPISPVPYNNNSNISWVIEPSGLHVFSAASYPNGPIILRLVRSGVNNCSEPYLYLRLIYPNVIVLNISTNDPNITAIPTFNFCPIPTTNPPRDLIRIFPLSYNHIMIAYLQINNGTGPETHEEFGKFIDWEGNVIQELNLGPINFTTNDTSSLGTLVVDSSQRYGFIWVNRVSQNETIRWQKYSISDQRIVSPSNNGNFSIDPTHQYKIIATIDGGYCFVMAGPLVNNNTLFPNAYWVASVVFIRPSPTYYTTLPSLIYQYMLQAVSMNIETCDNTYYEPELACVFSIKSSISNISSSYVRVAFYSSGGVKNATTLNITDNVFNIDTMYQLWSGGYLLVVRWQPNINNTFTGYIYDLQRNNLTIWDAPSSPGNFVIPNGVFTNNTVWMFSDVNSATPNISNWTLTTTIAKKFVTLDHVPGNLDINITFPNITEAYSNKELAINMTFYNKIALSVKNISIYQDSGTDLIPRLYYNAQNNSNKFNISSDSKVISINILSSTFASPQSRYYIVMDNNFIKDYVSDEPLSGANWSFTTGPKTEQALGSAEYALVRLNADESNNFNNLSKSGRSDYLYNLTKELAHSVPIDHSNLVAVNQFQWDKNVNNLQILLKFQILPNDNVNNLTVLEVIETLNDLITNRDVTWISKSKFSSNLDSQYGFMLKSNSNDANHSNTTTGSEKFENVWTRYGYNLIFIGLIPFFLAVLTLLSYRERNNGNNFMPFKILLIIFDFVIDLMFVLVYSRDLNVLFYPRTYHNVAAISTLCAGIDIDILTLITSKLANSPLFKAPLSQSSKNWISRVGCINFFIEDAPHCIVLGRIYKCLNRIETPNYSTIETSFHDHNDESSSKYSHEYIEDIPSSPSIVPETRVSPPSHVWIPSFGFGNHGIPRTHSERINLPLAPLGRHNKVNAMSVEKPRIITTNENIENIESISGTPGITITHIKDGERNGGEFEDDDSVISKRYKYHSGDYGLLNYKAADSNDDEFEQEDLDIRHKYHSNSRYNQLSNNAMDS